MKERPILFNGAMVRAILNGCKTQTRRIVRPQPDWLPEVHRTHTTAWLIWPIGALGQQCGWPLHKLPYGQTGDRLWVREAMLVDPYLDLRYAADDEIVEGDDGTWKYRSDEYVGGIPSIHMPRWACRLELGITGVSVERLQDISETDAQAEGVLCPMYPDDLAAASYAYAYRRLWESINGAGSWDANPWVWVVEFRRVTP